MALICGLWEIKSLTHSPSTLLMYCIREEFHIFLERKREKKERTFEIILNLHKLYQPEMRKTMLMLFRFLVHVMPEISFTFMKEWNARASE